MFYITGKIGDSCEYGYGECDPGLNLICDPTSLTCACPVGYNPQTVTIKRRDEQACIHNAGIYLSKET